jgi:hypothetical protein
MDKIIVGIIENPILRKSLKKYHWIILNAELHLYMMSYCLIIYKTDNTL